MAEAAPPTMSGTAVGEEANCSMMLPHGTPGLAAGSAPASGLQIQLNTARAALPTDTAGRLMFGANASPSVSILIGHQDRIELCGQNKVVSIPL
jgi:hypothetical protein